MSDIEKARQLFQEAGLAFPKIPDELAPRLKERDEWLFSTREIETSPYNLYHYVREIDRNSEEDYVVLSHSGHGANSYAIQYYLVRGPLRMFLHLSWGGVYVDAEKSTAKIRDCFSLADEVVAAAQAVGRFQPAERLTIVASDFYGSYWLPPGKTDRNKGEGFNRPVGVLAEALRWLTGPW
jgi:hypothetical protein